MALVMDVVLGADDAADDDIYYHAYISICQRIFYPFYIYLLTDPGVAPTVAVAVSSIQLWLFGIQLWK